MEDQLESDLLSTALTVLTGDICLQIGADILSACQPVKLGNDSGETAESLAKSPATWLCEDHVFFTLIKQPQSTLVFCHSNQVLYYASPAAQLSSACPSGTAFLCQFTIDSVACPTATGPPLDPLQPIALQREPRLLVFDLVSCERGLPPMARGERLRALDCHLHKPLCCVQWVGFGRYLTSAFVAQLPHRVRGIFRLGDDPLELGILIALSGV
jgi:hypothetical protein